MIRAFQWDLARQIERLDWLLAQLPRYAAWGYQELYLHLEDAVEYTSLPGVARPGAYTHRQLARLVAAATKVGIGVVPIVNLLGHTQYLIKVPELRDLNELRHPDGTPQEKGQLCPLHPRTLDVAERLLRDMAPFCTTGKVHVGLDESFHLGQHPASRREIARIGRAAHFARYVQRLHRLTTQLDLRLGLWADMLYFLPDAIPLLPRGLIAYDWYYYPFRRLPAVELFNFAACDLAGPLQRHGIDYWGCPMNGAFRHEPLPHFADRLANIKSWWRRCQHVHATGILLTSWEPNRLAQETTTLVDAAAAELWLHPANRRPQAMLQAGLRRAFGVKRPAPIATALLQADQHAFTGYARWEINKAWALASGPAGRAVYAQSAAFYRHLRRASRTWPAALAQSIRFRAYLAERDDFVRQNRDAVFQLRRLVIHHRSVASLLRQLSRRAQRFAPAIRRGEIAASNMWVLTRPRDPLAPNRQLLQRDRAQLIAWQHWLHACAQDPSSVFSANPLCGQWQLDFTVWNFAPAVQRVQVEQQIGRDWRVIKDCHTIEFRSAGAKPRSSIRQVQSAPVAAANEPGHPPALRLTVSGVGAVKIGAIQLTNGVQLLRGEPKGWLQLGSAPVPYGWPELAARTTVPLVFRSTHLPTVV